ncbi:hypothetical protein SAMN02745136_00966 [Anaerocolumna jejuensis DSM 15929]|uniref:Uncharacterized protein n=1 Tax=Anaerocolumna jejuensis DSM 15929 TaxID=1121322 RepID=A0A1M6ME73_9FIRM|nr:hypothetical protein [Anaerocolumna jejuensis]SHJ81666.1 hypothetical protein SAMN02745136_00966 [Anaerocolumna jejuensis DSM 15929]
MMYGKLNSDRICRVIEQILKAREGNVEVSVSLIPREESKGRKQQDKTA